MPMPPRMQGLESPEPIGGKPPKAMPPMHDEPDMDETEPDGDEGATLSPETVGYHEDSRTCGNCKHNLGGHCNVIGQPVGEEGACCVWEGGSEEGQPSDMSMQPPAGQMPGGQYGR